MIRVGERCWRIRPRRNPLMKRGRAGRCPDDLSRPYLVERVEVLWINPVTGRARVQAALRKRRDDPPERRPEVVQLADLFESYSEACEVSNQRWVWARAKARERAKEQA